MKNMIGIAGIVVFVSAGSCLAAGGSFEERLKVSNIAGIEVAAPAAPHPGPGHHPGGPGNGHWPQPHMDL